MVRQCFVCKNLDYLNPELSFHRFPKNPQIVEQYLSMLNMNIDMEKELPKNALICSDHFDQRDFEFRGETKIKFIKQGTLPLPFKSATSDVNTSNSFVEEIFPKMEIIKSEFDIEDDNLPSGSTFTASDCDGTIKEEPIFYDEGEQSCGSSTDSAQGVDMIDQVNEMFGIFKNPPPKTGKIHIATNLYNSDFPSHNKEIEQQNMSMKTKLIKQQKKIKVLQQSVRRLKAQVNKLRSQINTLKAQT